MRFLTAVVAAVATLSGDADAALSPGYWCQRRVDGDGEPIGHRGVCGRRNACQESSTKMVMSNLCNKLPSWSVCCLETPTEPAMEWDNGDSAEYNADITKDQLKCCMRIHNFRFTDSLANETYEPVKEAMRFGNIKSKYQVSAFLAQVGAESGSLQWFRELGNRNCGGYDGGCRYKGRGPIQLTHRYNYRKAQSWLRENNLISSSQDIVRNPELAETKRIGFLTTVWFWTVSARLNTLSNTNKYQDFFKLSRKINGGLRGINHRVDRWRHCAQCMGANVMPEIDMSGNGAPAPVGEGGSHGGSQDGRDSSIAALGSDHGNFSKDSECGAIGGTCMESRHCTGASFYHATVSSKCGGGATRTCCVTKCRKNRDGECGTPSSCSGSTVSGQCPGRFDKCCPGVAPGELLQLSTGSLLQTSAAEAPAVEIPIEPTQVRDNKRTEEGGSAHVRQGASAIVSRLMANPAQFVAQVVEALKTKVREGLVPAEELYNLVEAGAMEGVMDTYNFWTNRLEDEEEIANKCVTSIESLKDLSTSATLLDELKSFDKNNLSAESSSFLAPDVHATESGENDDAPAHKAVPEVDDSAVLAEAAGPQ